MRFAKQRRLRPLLEGGERVRGGVAVQGSGQGLDVLGGEGGAVFVGLLLGLGHRELVAGRDQIIGGVGDGLLGGLVIGLGLLDVLGGRGDPLRQIPGLREGIEGFFLQLAAVGLLAGHRLPGLIRRLLGLFECLLGRIHGRLLR